VQLFDTSKRADLDCPHAPTVEAHGEPQPQNVRLAADRDCQYPLPPNAELAGDTGAAFAVWASGGTTISETNARAAINFLMTDLHVAKHCSRFLDEFIQFGSAI